MARMIQRGRMTKVAGRPRTALGISRAARRLDRTLLRPHQRKSAIQRDHDTVNTAARTSSSSSSSSSSASSSSNAHSYSDPGTKTSSSSSSASSGSRKSSSTSASSSSTSSRSFSSDTDSRKSSDSPAKASTKGYMWPNGTAVTYLCLRCDYKIDGNHNTIEKHSDNKHGAKRLQTLAIGHKDRKRYEPIFDKQYGELTLTCRECGFEAGSHVEFRNHWVQHLDMQWRCGHCGVYEAADKQQVLYHARTDHPGVLSNVMKLENLRAVPDDRSDHPSDGEKLETTSNGIAYRIKADVQFGCTKCGFSSGELKPLEEHFIKWHKPRYQCVDCSYRVRLIDDMKKHLSSNKDHEYVEIDDETLQRFPDAVRRGLEAIRKRMDADYQKPATASRYVNGTSTVSNRNEKRINNATVVLKRLATHPDESVSNKKARKLSGPSKANLPSQSKPKTKVLNGTSRDKNRLKKAMVVLKKVDAEPNESLNSSLKKKLAKPKRRPSKEKENLREMDKSPPSSLPELSKRRAITVEEGLTYRCHYCPERLDNELEFGLHMNRHIKFNRTVTAKPIDAKDRGLSTAKLLYRQHVHPCFCCKCGKSFFNLSSGKSHATTAHRGPSKVNQLGFSRGKPCDEIISIIFEEFAAEESYIERNRKRCSASDEERNDKLFPPRGLQPDVILTDLADLPQPTRRQIMASYGVEKYCI